MYATVSFVCRTMDPFSWKEAKDHNMNTICVTQVEAQTKIIFYLIIFFLLIFEQRWARTTFF